MAMTATRQDSMKTGSSGSGACRRRPLLRVEVDRKEVIDEPRFEVESQPFISASGCESTRSFRGAEKLFLGSTKLVRLTGEPGALFDPDSIYRLPDFFVGRGRGASLRRLKAWWVPGTLGMLVEGTLFPLPKTSPAVKKKSTSVMSGMTPSLTL